MEKQWIISEDAFEPEKRKSHEAIYTLGNGYIGCRGFFEEEEEGIEALGGIYFAGVFGKGRDRAWKGVTRELANTPNFFYVSIEVDGQKVLPRKENLRNYTRRLNMKEGILERSYIWIGEGGKEVEFRFQRFVSIYDVHIAGQRLEIIPHNCSPDIKLEACINSNISNLNEISSEPLPVQPGKKHIQVKSQTPDIIYFMVDGNEAVEIAENQYCLAQYSGMDVKVSGIDKPGQSGRKYCAKVAEGKRFSFERLVRVHTSRDEGSKPFDAVCKCSDLMRSYADELEKHKKAWGEKWYNSDIEIAGDASAQSALRFNIFQLIQACPEWDDRLSIGARGLTGEMYEGCVFWDTEIFKLPFFMLTNPHAAAGLLKFRYRCLPEAREHAESNWFEGAMYAWQSCEKGIEQTPKGVGAFYAIHITADIAYSVMRYWEATGDNQFMRLYGTEILIETARFWKSRVYYNPVKKNYNLLAVRGPNEYDVVVNNNTYTNMMAVENLASAIKAIEFIKAWYMKDWKALAERLCFADSEIVDWEKIINGMVICYDRELDLYEEDDMYLYRVPLDMMRAKPTGKRIIDSTIPYEALPLYQVTKQADIICLMNLLPFKFSKQQMENAWNFYEPKTAHDSSLSYCHHAIMAARLGKMDMAYKYFKTSAYLDIEDVQLNTVSGLHFANFGGTWQIVVFGFAGVSIKNGILHIKPNLPESWKYLKFRLRYRGSILRIEIEDDKTNVVCEKSSVEKLFIKIGNQDQKCLNE